MSRPVRFRLGGVHLVLLLINGPRTLAPIHASIPNGDRDEALPVGSCVVEDENHRLAPRYSFVVDIEVTGLQSETQI